MNKRWAYLFELFVKFASAGLVGTCAHYSLLILLVQGVSFSPVTASLVGAIVGASINYCLSYWLVFKSVRRHRETLVKFSIIASGAVVFNTLLMYVLVKAVGLPYIFAQILTTLTTLIYGFVANTIWTFGHKVK